MLNAVCRGRRVAAEAGAVAEAGDGVEEAARVSGRGAP
jgi:hypothetical protein